MVVQFVHGRLADAAYDEFGKVDILVNNAGILRDKSFAKMEPEDFRFVVDVHLNGTFYGTRAAARSIHSSAFSRMSWPSMRMRPDSRS